MKPTALALSVLAFLNAFPRLPARAERTQKPVLHGKSWVAITGKPLAATAGALIFQRGGNAADAAAAMLAATCTLWDTLSWGGETQALIYDPIRKQVKALNALGVAPTGATPEWFRAQGLRYPPGTGPLAAITPGTPGGLLTLLAEYGRLSLQEVLQPAIELAQGYPVELELSREIERHKALIKKWPYAQKVLLPHLGQAHEGPQPGELLRQPELAATLQKLVAAEQEALRRGRPRREAIYAAYDRFYKGDLAQEFVRSVKEQGGLITLDDLARWRVYLEEPVHTSYKGIEVYKLNTWVQGPVLLQALNILENFDLRAMGYNSARYIHTLYQAMNLAFADRDFYYGDPYVPPSEPLQGLLSKEYGRARARLIQPDRNDDQAAPGDPYPYQGEQNPFRELLKRWPTTRNGSQEGLPSAPPLAAAAGERFAKDFYAGTTSIEAADAAGWVVSVTPSGGWVPAVIAGHTGVGLSQRMQAFVTDPAEGPFNVVAPGKRPRATLTPSLALRDGQPLLAFAVQGGDSQDQNLLQFFLNVVEFGFTVQEAAEAANFNSYQLRSSFGNHESKPGAILLNAATPPWVRGELRRMGYQPTLEERTSGPINAIWFDRAHGTLWGGSSNHGDDYGIAW